MSDSNKDPDDQGRPQRSAGSQSRGGQGYGQRRPASSSAGRKPHGDRDQKRPYGDRSERKPYGDRDAKRTYGDRSDRKPYGDRDQQSAYGDRTDRKPYSDRDQRSSGNRDGRKSYGDRDQQRPYGERSDRKPYGDRDANRSYGDRSDRKPYGDRDAKRSYGERSDRKPYGDRDAKRSYGDRSDRKPYGDRDAKRPYGDRSDRKPYGDRDAKRPYGDRSDRKPYGDRDGERRGASNEPTHERHGAADLPVRERHDDPLLPDRIEARQLDKVARAELKTLSKENADWVARHLVAASEFLDTDPELAHRHAMSAARRAGRIAMVRETLAITAYATGDFALALRELRTYRRISGSNDQLPLMVDSERGVGRPDRALEVGRAVDRNELPVAVQVGLAIAMSGARLDLEQPELALAELEIPQLDPDRAFSYSPALFSAYAEVLEELGREADSSRWRSLADRAEAALAGPAEAELIEIFELEDDEPRDEGATDDSRVRADDEGIEAADGDEDEPEPGEVPAGADSDEELGDPADALEDDVRAVLAEGGALDEEAADAELATEDSADGAVPSAD